MLLILALSVAKMPLGDKLQVYGLAVDARSRSPEVVGSWEPQLPRLSVQPSHA
jgi:hypothetical protein